MFKIDAHSSKVVLLHTCYGTVNWLDIEITDIKGSVLVLTVFTPDLAQFEALEQQVADAKAKFVQWKDTQPLNAHRSEPLDEAPSSSTPSNPDDEIPF